MFSLWWLRFFTRKYPTVRDYRKSVSSSTVIKSHTDNGETFKYELSHTGEYKTTLNLPQKFYENILGPQGANLKRLENNTWTKILIPSRKTINSTIIITGRDEKGLIAARKELKMIGDDLRRRHMITHFISLPMVNQDVKTNFNNFKKSILTDAELSNIHHESIFQKVEKLHLTIGVFVLLDQNEIKEVCDCMEELQKEIVEPQLKNLKPFVVRIKGLDYMQNKPEKVRVLYAKVHVENHEDREILQTVSNDIYKFFKTKGLVKNEKHKAEDNVKIHVTLINTKYFKSRPNKKIRRFHNFNAKLLLEKFGDFDFGLHTINEIHLSNIATVDETGYYKPTHTITL